jgi:hypothetical protein
MAGGPCARLISTSPQIVKVSASPRRFCMAELPSLRVAQPLAVDASAISLVVVDAMEPSVNFELNFW